MAIGDTTERYGGVSQALHWGTAVVIAGAWILGATMEDLPRGASRAAGLDLHATLGLAVVAAVLARLLWRAANPRPDVGPGLMGLAARGMHLAVYAIMLVVPLSGLADRWARGPGVSVLFGSATLEPPFAIPGGRLWGEVHETAANLLLALIAVHVAAALWHHFVLRDGLLWRMLPRRSQAEARSLPSAG
ncbi:cytochrome b [Elioraea rosea]|uniref:cytochrome b n=1 Tax=Elioraea rosea TaxID=2492390 RepID=UPI0011843088|nr:cytochrome b [Elioraea rosea]